MNKFIVLFLAPAAVMTEWMQKPEAERAEAEMNMRTEWDAWMAAHKDMIKETNGVGKTKRVTGEGAADAKNDIMIYSIIEAESHDVAAKAYESHPHLAIPQSTIEISAIRPM